eukprot:gene9022-9986_t
MPAAARNGDMLETEMMSSVNEKDSLIDQNQPYILYKRRWLILTVFSLISMSNEVIWISLSAINSITTKYFQVTAIAVDWLSMIYLLMFALVSALTTYLLDKCGLKFMLVIGAVLNGIGSCLRCIGSGRDGFVFVFIGSGFGALAQCFLLFIPPRLAAVWFGDHERAKASAIGIAVTISGVAFGFLASLMVPNSTDMEYTVRNGMNNMLITQAVLCSIFVILAVVCVQDVPPTPPSRSQALVQKLQQGDFISNMALLKSEEEFVTSGFTEQKQQPQQQPRTIEDAAGKCATNYNYGGTGVEQTQQQISHENNNAVKFPNFRESLLVLSKDKQFHILCQSYALNFASMAAYTTVLNRLITLKHPGKEKEIGYLGCVMNLLGVTAMFPPYLSVS